MPLFIPPLIHARSPARSHGTVTVLGIKGKYGAVARNLWVYFLFWECARLLLPLQNVPRKRVCMVENHSYRIWGAPDFCLPPSTHVLPA